MLFSRRDKPLRFKGPEKQIINDTDHTEDFYSAEQFGRVRLGRLCLYYRDLGKKYFVPYEYIHRAFTRISECPEDEFSNNHEYYRLILVHDGKEFANLIFNVEKTIDQICEKLIQIRPDIAIGVERK